MTQPLRILVLGARGGIGRSLVSLLEETDWTVLESGHRSKQAPTAGLDVEALCPGEVESCVQRTAEEAPLDAVVNLMGSLSLQPPSRVTMKELHETLQLHVGSCFEILRAAPKAIRQGGSIVFVSSAAAHLGLANHEAIAAAKAGIEGLTRAAAATLSTRRIRVNAVAPGLVETPLSAGLTSREAVRKASEAMHAAGRIGRPEDVARAIRFVLESEWMTGEVLRIDGGLSQVRSPRS